MQDPLSAHFPSRTQLDEEEEEELRTQAWSEEFATIPNVEVTECILYGRRRALVRGIRRDHLWGQLLCDGSCGLATVDSSDTEPLAGGEAPHQLAGVGHKRCSMHAPRAVPPAC
jgi:hypothetical protein